MFSLTGRNLEDFAKEYFFDSMGIANYHLGVRQKSIDGKSLVLTVEGLYMTWRSMAKVGVMKLQMGLFDGTSILSDEYIGTSVQDQPPDSGYPYGFYWHLNKSLGHIRKVWRCIPCNWSRRTNYMLSGTGCDL